MVCRQNRHYENHWLNASSREYNYFIHSSKQAINYNAKNVPPYIILIIGAMLAGEGKVGGGLEGWGSVGAGGGGGGG